MRFFVGIPILLQMNEGLEIRLEQKRIGLTFTPDRGFGSRAVVVSRENAGLIRQREEFLMKGMVFSLGARTEVGAAHFAHKQRITRKDGVAHVDTHRIVAMSGRMNDRDLQIS